MNKLIIISLQPEKYKKLAKCNLPSCYIRMCTVDVCGNEKRITSANKSKAIKEFWKKNYFIEKQINDESIFNFEIV